MPRPRKCLEFIGPTASVAGGKRVLGPYWLQVEEACSGRSAVLFWQVQGNLDFRNGDFQLALDTYAEALERLQGWLN